MVSQVSSCPKLCVAVSRAPLRSRRPVGTLAVLCCGVPVGNTTRHFACAQTALLPELPACPRRSGPQRAGGGWVGGG
jgi:hypothetical protein